MKARFQPSQQARFGAGQIDASHPNLGESKLARPLPDQGDQLRAIDVHAGIVGTQSLAEAQAKCLAKAQTLLLASEDDTRRLAERIARAPALRHAFIALQGELGAGKTSLVRHLLRALGVTGRVKSPTYAVLEQHEAQDALGQPLAVSHFDFYRFNDAREFDDAGFRDQFAAPGLKLAEWPEKALGPLPPADLSIRIEVQSDMQRRVQLQAFTACGQALLEQALGR